VGAAGFRELLAGRDPLDGRGLRAARGDRPVSGFDLAFCAPKSVSVLHLLAPRELGAAVGSAHEAAVDDALGYLERHGHGVRRVRSGHVHHLASTGAVAAAFVHRTSRALDPHLHTHLVAANVAQGVDGTWSSLDSRRLFLHRRATEAVYGASLRHHLTAAAGVDWRRGDSGRWEVDGVDPVLCRLFSQRTASIDEFVAGNVARTPAGLRRAAFFADRPDKERGTTVDGLRSTWRRRVAAIDVDTGDLVRTVGRSRTAHVPEVVDEVALRSGLERLVATRTRVSVRDLVATVADSAPRGLPGGAADRVATALGAGATRAPLSEARHPSTWSPAELTAALRGDPELVDRALADRALVGRDPGHGAPEVRAPRTDRDGPATAPGRRPGISPDALFGHRGPDSVGLVR